jgi:predicted nucleotidyltransferase
MRALRRASVISGEDRALLTEVKKTIQGFLPTAQVLLYGSVARGSKESGSDYDILILTDEPLSKEEERAVESAIFDLELQREVVLATIYYSRDEWNSPIVRVSPFHNQVERDAIVL